MSDCLKDAPIGVFDSGFGGLTVVREIMRQIPNEKIVYFGPMGCRTGFYLILAGDYTSKEALPIITKTFEFIRDFRGEVPGASAKDCGNYLDMNLPMANFWGRRYAALLENIDGDHLIYPE